MKSGHILSFLLVVIAGLIGWSYGVGPQAAGVSLAFAVAGSVLITTAPERTILNPSLLAPLLGDAFAREPTALGKVCISLGLLCLLAQIISPAYIIGTAAGWW